MSKKHRENFYAGTPIPIYKGWLTLSVSESVVETRRSKSKVFGEYLGGDATALAASSFDECEYGLFFAWDRLKHGIISHEIFHLTHRILESCDVHFDSDNHEAFAYFNTWMTDWVYRQLKASKVKIIAG